MYTSVVKRELLLKFYVHCTTTYCTVIFVIAVNTRASRRSFDIYLRANRDWYKRLSLIVRVNVVLNRTVVVDSD